MKPFELEAALAGKKVVRGDGVEVKVTRLALTTPMGSSLISQTEGSGRGLMFHNIDGTATLSYDYGLFMAGEDQTVYINLWDSPSFHYTKHNSLAEAKKATGATYTGRRYKKLNAEPIVIIQKD
jgi:hypothetical protein